ncbi:MAG: hypothetical protein N4A64_06485 [Marinisporobacter sp.]|jgi:IMP cyclohydrolase|nr:hypothetical protein [Marinisporobacter sp.]
MEKEVLILTKSDKNGGYCVAGVDRENGKFIRLVSDDTETEYALSKYDIEYDDHTELEVMDIIKVKLKEKQECWYQPENYIIDREYYFLKIAKTNIQEIKNYIMTEPYIFYNSDKSVDETIIKNQLNKYSLIMFRVDKLNLWKNKYKDRKIMASFDYNGESYSFIKITDSNLTEIYYDKVSKCAPRPFVIEGAILVMSLAGSHSDGRHYKLIANIIEDEQMPVFAF